MESFIHRDFQSAAEDVCLEFCFKRISIRRAFDLVRNKALDVIVTQHLFMVGFHSNELFDLYA